MAHLLLIIVLSSVLAVSAKPSCTSDENLRVTTCAAGDDDYGLIRGLVSDNNETTSIILRNCRITDVGLESFHGLPKLLVLDLADNMIRTLKLGVLDSAKQLTHLHLVNNLLTELPLGLFDQNTRLELLDLKGNALSSFELGIFHPLSRLGHLDLSSNNFLGRDFDKLLFEKTSSITFIDFSGSDMRDTPDDLLKAIRFIYFINLSGCSLTEVPKFATRSNLKTMNHLMLLYNKIAKLEDLDTFVNLINLEKLNLGGNPLESLHGDIFKPLKQLKSVVLSDGQLQEIPENLFRDLKKITEIDLSNNLIEFVPVNAFRGTRLKQLKLNNNRFTYLTDNFVLELANSGATLSLFQFDKNPWQCACLRDILEEVKIRGVKYSTTNYDGKHKECVTTKQFICKRQPKDSEIFVDMYFNSV